MNFFKSEIFSLPIVYFCILLFIIGVQSQLAPFMGDEEKTPLAEYNTHDFLQPVDCVPFERKSRPSYFSIVLKSRNVGEPMDLIKFHLFTRRNTECTQEIVMNNTDHLWRTNFNSEWPTRIIIHGWLNGLNSRINEELKTAYLLKGDFNIICMDWSLISVDSSYEYVTNKVPKMGQVLSQFLEFLYNERAITYDKVYLIGHSIGAHIAGNAGYYSKYKIGTILALDPADKRFKHASEDVRIDASDAEYVESIHTNTALLGLKQPVGHASFYPNYGAKQLGCERKLKPCSHSRAYTYLAESINSPIGFWGAPCNTIKDVENHSCDLTAQKIMMGGEPVQKKEGIFYVPIRESIPYAMGPNF